ncbi:MAG: aminofutalosine synthase MqnE [Bacteroidetes bacterium]|nr:MAG: aminofutalosine synthase MqnE [Bacteroidota bacterium]RLD85531.1 MAG: aminofutalosine synthase MqnE [Bacteroidota bacterium]
MNSDIKTIIENSTNSELRRIAEKIINSYRITETEGVMLFEKGELGFLGSLANFVREKKHGDKTYFNRNFHIEPTNICIYNCKFCSYVRKIGQEGAWEFSLEQVLDIVQSYKDKKVTEVHIVGGVHPKRDLHYYGNMIQKIKEILPEIHVKAFTAVELDFMIKKARVSIKEGLLKLKEYGLDSIPGGGAEIFNEKIRKEVCDEKSSTEMWLNIHKTAHEVGIPSNATILYGHIESYADRIDHMKRLRDLQDQTGMFNTYIPLKFRKENNKLSHIGEVNTIEDLKNYAVSRIYLDNFDHIKAYWPMIGKSTAQLSLSYGVDDIDGTIDDTTKIYSMAGVEDKSPTMNSEELANLIKEVNRIPIERDTLYNVVKDYTLNG